MVLAVAVAAVVRLPATAPAATVTVTGDDGSPVALSAAPTALRQLKPDLAVALGGDERGYSLSIAGPAGAALAPSTCSTSAVPRRMDYQGNGSYTVSVTTYTNASCTVGAAPATYQIALNASTALTPPAATILIRRPGDFAAIDHQVPIALNPGALAHEVRIAERGTLAPDGGIAGASDQLYPDATTGAVALRLESPGDYVMVARAQGYTGAAGQFYSPWSAPIRFRALAPFDFQGSVSFPDSRGPSYALRGRLRETSARGKIRIKLARSGQRRFLSIGSARINRRGVFKKRFTLRRVGRYRIRYSFKGSATTAPGTVTQKVTIRRRFF